MPGRQRVKGGAEQVSADPADHENLSDAEREQRSVDAIRHLSLEVADLIDCRRRIALVRSILGHAKQDVPVRRALMALDGATIVALEDVTEPDESRDTGA